MWVPQVAPGTSLQHSMSCHMAHKILLSIFACASPIHVLSSCTAMDPKKIAKMTVGCTMSHKHIRYMKYAQYPELLQ